MTEAARHIPASFRVAPSVSAQLELTADEELMMDARTWVVACVLLLGACVSTGGSPTEIPHGYCRTVWLLGLSCDQVNSAFVAQISATKSYKLGPVTSHHIEAKHTSADGQMEIVGLSTRPAFMEQGCHVEGTSVSVAWDSGLVGDANYCNLNSLIQRSGLTRAPGFIQFANEWLCPGYQRSACTGP